MTLTKIKARRPSMAVRQRRGEHHRYNHSYLKTYWPYLPIVMVIGCGFGINNWIGQLHKNVLGYATDMSIQSLLDDTNVQRADNGEGPLTINADLDQAAQTKANDMATQDYWSHDTPEGQTPWSFMIAAGYDYQTAGENLAYGFDTSQDVLTAWMNSPDHRANILNTTYHDIGIGIVNIANYQNSGPETLIDAMYGSLAGEAVVAATPAPQTTTAPAANQIQPSSTPPATTSPSPTSTPTSTPVNTQLATTQPSTAPAAASDKSNVIEPQQEPISRIQLVATGDPSEGVLLLTLFGFGAFAFLLFRHGIAWRKTLLRGEKFVLQHPLLDFIAITLVTASVIMSRTAGLIR
ncbi:MAG: CAP domain-containing protein [Candidatus Saccharimonadales bacterium]